MSPGIYGLLIGLGASFGMWRVTQSVPQNLALKYGGYGLAVLASALIGARTGFLLWQPAFVAQYSWHALRFWEGGFIWPGAVAGAWISIAILALIQRQKFLILMDPLSSLLPPVAIMTWLACIPEGCGYGAPLSINTAWLMVVDQRGVISSRFPTQLLGAAVLFLAFYIFERVFSSKKTGLRSALIWVIFSIHTLLFSFLRADIRPLWKIWPVDIWAAFALLLLAVSYLAVVVLRKSLVTKAA